MDWNLNIQKEVSWAKEQGARVHPLLKFSVIPNAGSCITNASRIEAGETLLSLPNNVLINKTTCSWCPFAKHLTSFQLLSWILCKGKSTGMEKWPYYIEALPQDFSWHPVMFSINDPVWSDVPKDVQKLVLERKQSLLQDYQSISKFEKLDWAVFQWAWLCVNTRCLYYQIASSSSDEQLTLAPVFEYFNHSFDAQTDLQRSRTGISIIAKRAIEKDEQLYLCYGAHGNDQLFSEYGFCLGENPLNHFALDDEFTFTEKQEEFLKCHGYWKDYTFSMDGPSFRTLIALRVLLVSKSTDLFDSNYDATRKLLQYMNGLSDGSRESPMVQALWDRHLTVLLQIVRKQVAKMDELRNKDYTQRCILQLWKDRQMCIEYLLNRPIE
ncbi:ribosomal protein lysine methyltransferase Set11 [Schizosaccharomyces cryophilus OY26]|uniref:Ribosomal protein lysine methyltransferase Set11 n=1 Tax=Schizosaccharomyces cryophilus (strain OY26 / ATCC MYA-4695 / CBS 11777 / NBRC 106824 / NRRL Y48691) TaxID=653667 RepID=S9W109_SCHCR|nr:ribosomal protein lysine methyltransferase Set11 [Schizosaccharomyces cryophilus OY26]EPY52144.1 ribosomal protein lysine methyltransferase Set11 [Schizosaccharomyces cryophilus OY26]